MNKIIITVLIISALCVAAAPINRSRLRQQLKLANKRSPDTDGFWLEAWAMETTKCTPQYMDLLAKNFNKLPGNSEPEMVEMYQALKQKIVEECGDDYDVLAEKINQFCLLDDLCDFIVNGYRVNQDADLDFKPVFPDRISQVVRVVAGSNITTYEEFKKVYDEKSPCRALNDKVNVEFAEHDYAEFIQMITVPEYYELADDSNQCVADRLAGCKFIQNTPEILPEAFKIYTGAKKD